LLLFINRLNLEIAWDVVLVARENPMDAKAMEVAARAVATA
jgi:hypothetical protein